MTDKCQKKLFQFLLLGVVLRNSLDIYKVTSLYFIMVIWVIHWLVSKRSKGLVGEENRNFTAHAKLIVLMIGLVVMDATVSYIFILEFSKYGNSMNDIYIIVGFEFGRLLLKAIEDNFKY